MNKPKRVKFSFLDFVILRVLVDHFKQNGMDALPYTQKELVIVKNRDEGIINEWLSENKVGLDYTGRITSNRALIESVDRWRLIGYLQPEGSYIPTEKGFELFEKLGDDWRSYPKKIELDENGDFNWNAAKYDKSVNRKV